MINKENDAALLEQLISSQIPEAEDPRQAQPMRPEDILDEGEPEDDEPAPVQQAPVQQPQRAQAPAHQEEAVENTRSEAAQYLGTQLSHVPGKIDRSVREQDKEMVEKLGLSRVGENIKERADIREGWIDVDRSLLGERDIFYPESWQFRIRPATVEAIRNWSNIDEENPLSVDSVLNEILKSCLSIITPEGNIPWGNICTWDRFFFLLLIREYTFVQGERVISYEDECPECENMITFTLESGTLMFEMPDPEVLKYYDRETRTWNIDPEEYELYDEQPFTLYIPTLDKDANMREWFVDKVRENPNKKKYDQTFFRFLPWLAPKISKDLTIARRQIRELQNKFNGFSADLFSFMDEVIRNITVSPMETLTIKCPICGEEVTSRVRFPNGPRGLFNVQGKYKRFGKK